MIDYPLPMLSGGFTPKEKQQLASNWQLPRELLKKVKSTIATMNGSVLRTAVKDGKLADCVVTWLDLPESCFTAPSVAISFRRPKHKDAALSYAVVKLPTKANHS